MLMINIIVYVQPVTSVGGSPGVGQRSVQLQASLRLAAWSCTVPTCLALTVTVAAATILSS